MWDNYIEETKPLFKILKTEAFQFVIVRYNHIKFVRQLQNDLIEKFPDRLSKTLNCREFTYQKLMEEYFSLEKGFLFLEDFGSLLQTDEQNSLEKYRKKEILGILNRRRDKLAQYPIALIVFVPATIGMMYSRKMIENMPDMWSFRSLILDIKGDVEILRTMTNIVEPSAEEKADLKKIKNEKRKELKLLLSLLNKTPDDEVRYKLTLYPQIVKIQTFLEKYEDALLVIEEWEKSTKHNVLSIEDFLDYKADILFNLERFDELTIEYNKWIEILENNIKIAPHKTLHHYSLYVGLSYNDAEIDNIFQNYSWFVENIQSLMICYQQLAQLKLEKENFYASIENYEKVNDLLINNPSIFDSNKNLDFLLYNNYYQIARNHQLLGNKELQIFNIKKAVEYLEKLVETHYENEQYQYELEQLYDYIKQLELKA